VLVIPLWAARGGKGRKETGGRNLFGRDLLGEKKEKRKRKAEGPGEHGGPPPGVGDHRWKREEGKGGERKRGWLTLWRRVAFGFGVLKKARGPS